MWSGNTWHFCKDDWHSRVDGCRWNWNYTAPDDNSIKKSTSPTMALYKIVMNTYLKNVYVNFIRSLFQKILFINDLIKDNGNFPFFWNFQKRIRISASPKHWKELIKIVPGQEICDSKIKKIKKIPKGFKTLFLHILIVCRWHLYYP